MIASWPVFLGRFGLWALCAGALFALVFSVLDLRSKSKWSFVAKRSFLTSCIGSLLTVFGLQYALFTHDFSIRYVATVSSKSQPTMYLFSAWWGSLEGGLLLWAFLICLFTFLAIFKDKLRGSILTSFLLLPSATLCFFSGLMLKFANPLASFDDRFTIPLDGIGMNPLLQDPGMAIHPPLLYLGFTGITIPAAYAITHLLNKNDEWIQLSRYWTNYAWFFLTTGILVGSWWAYHELGWGGWWFWDPVENASLMPWLLLTAFAHSALAFRARKLFNRWNLFLILAAYGMTLVGTFITRSGIITSVHAFSESDLGYWFLGYITVYLLFAFGFLGFNWDSLKDNSNLKESASKENAILFNNLLFLGMFVAVFFGTTWPIFSEISTGEKVSVGAPYFEKTIPPISMPALILLSVAPWLSWKRKIGKKFKNYLKIGIVGGLLSFLFFSYIRSSIGLPWFDSSWEHFLTTFLLGFTLLPTFREFLDSKKGRFLNSYHGGLIVHVGVLFLAIGATASVEHKFQTDAILENEIPFVLDDYDIELIQDANGLQVINGENYSSFGTSVKVSSDSSIKTLYPEKRDYGPNWSPTTEMGLKSNWKRDITLSMSEIINDSKVRYRVTIQPFLKFIWIGGVVSILGFLIIVGSERR